MPDDTTETIDLLNEIKDELQENNLYKEDKLKETLVEIIKIERIHIYSSESGSTAQRREKIRGLVDKVFNDIAREDKNE